MNQRLLWNFELSPKAPLPLNILIDKKDQQLKWEVRYFWPDNQAIILNTIDESLRDLANYRQKHKEDHYYLLPDTNYNIKQRHNQLLYKPLVKHTDFAYGYGSKMILAPVETRVSSTESIAPDMQELIHQIEHDGVGVFVKKEAFIYKFPTKPSIKLELARLEVLNHIYFSVCVEGKSRYLVETLSRHLLGEGVSCDYVTFLKNIPK